MKRVIITAVAALLLVTPALAQRKPCEATSGAVARRSAAPGTLEARGAASAVPLAP